MKTLSEVIEEELPQAEVTVLSGPSHAEEVSRGLPTTCVAGAHSKAAAEYVQKPVYESCIPCIHKPGHAGD